MAGSVKMIRRDVMKGITIPTLMTAGITVAIGGCVKAKSLYVVINLRKPVMPKPAPGLKEVIATLSNALKSQATNFFVLMVSVIGVKKIAE